MFSKPKKKTPSTEKEELLEVDTSMVNHYLRCQEQLNKLVNPIMEENIVTKIIKPSPGLCIKTKEISTGFKVFVNLCKAEDISPPKDISEKELMRIIESDEPINYIIPMCISSIEMDKDKNGQEVKICDVAVHPTFFKKVEEIDEFKDYCLTIIFLSLENKYGLVCQEEKLILKNRKTYGTLQSQAIQLPITGNQEH